MRILVIGAGGREHALAWRLSQCHGTDVGVAPGNSGLNAVAWRCPEANTTEAYLDAAEEFAVDLTVVGPEAPLAAGIVDRFRQADMKIVGPTAAAAELECSKAFSKAFMERNGIPTARFMTATNEAELRSALKRFSLPVVLKADGLAAGKGVIVARSSSEAESAIPRLIATGRVVVEEFLEGEEVSFIVLTDGSRFVAFPPSQDHKTALDNDQGPNTGGMGAYSDECIISAAETADIEAHVIAPAIEGMKCEGRPFTGFLYAGLMMTAAGPKVLEFNARLGDPEAQVLMHRLRGNFAEVLAAAAAGDLSGLDLENAPDPSVCVVMAAHGYPGQVRTGDPIHGIPEAEQTGCIVFHAGTREEDGVFRTAGGRVLGVTASGADLKSAIANAYAGVERIHFDGMHYRRDIGRKGLRHCSDG